MTGSTVAELLGQYRRDLDEQGIDPSTAQYLVRDAAHYLHRDETVPLARLHARCCKCAAAGP